MANKTTTDTKKSWQRFQMKGIRLNLKKSMGLSVLGLGLILTAAIAPQYLKASDHDDGETDTKSRNQNLTDLFVFRERDQNPNVTNDDLVFIMNTNPRSLARQQYYFNTRAIYEFKIGRVANNTDPAKTTPDVTLRFQFDAPGQNGAQAQQQRFTMTVLRGTSATSTATGFTTPLSPDPNAAPAINQVSLEGAPLSVFAGLREDPFFFDVEQYFRIRAAARGIGPVPPTTGAVAFRPASKAVDFTKGYNVNAIAVKVPRAFLQAGNPQTTFDVWETVSVGSASSGFTQVERLARPLINEALNVRNDNLNALNSVGPDFEAAALAGTLPPNLAAIANSVITDASQTLTAIGNDSARTNAILGSYLPDVMRINTTQPSTYGPDITSNPNCLITPKDPTVPVPICGRKPGDDIVDLTLSVVIPGTNPNLESDNVSYNGNNPVSQGHQPLSLSLPYLAPAN